LKSVRIDTGITVQFAPESLFSFDRNRCSVSTGMGVQFGPEYAVGTCYIELLYPYLLQQYLSEFTCMSGRQSQRGLENSCFVLTPRMLIAQTVIGEFPKVDNFPV
jgi:hypothetical protein